MGIPVWHSSFPRLQAAGTLAQSLGAGPKAPQSQGLARVSVSLGHNMPTEEWLLSTFCRSLSNVAICPAYFCSLYLFLKHTDFFSHKGVKEL